MAAELPAAAAAPRTLALCFLVGDADVPLSDAWAAWLATGADAGGRNPRARVFVHSAQYAATPEARAHPALAGAAASARFVPWERTCWGKFGIVRAQQRLFEAALAERDVACCVLLSGDCAPLAPFDAVFEALVGAGGAPPRRSLLAVEDGPLNTTHERRERSARDLERAAREHKDLAAWPADWPWRWAVASQWCALQRKEAELLRKGWPTLEACFDGADTPDEHAYAVFFRGALGGDAGFDECFERRGPMLVEWGAPGSEEAAAAAQCATCREHDLNERRECSPRTFHLAELSPELVRGARARGKLFVRKLCLASIRATGPSAADELSARTWRLSDA
jgi:hypothetical protein